MAVPALRRPRFALPAMALLLSLAGTGALAQPVGPTSQRDKLTPEQRQKLFPEMRRLTLQDHRARIAILQRGESCINSANTQDALAACLRSQRDAMHQQRRQHMTDLQALFQRNGLPMPQWRRLEKPQRPGAAEAGAET
ncbi:MAG: hypothetical protein VKO39_11350 [Cyanobacteriota bacterium]|nr:hypothetical protein [Cyanobacteriota bacterium]